VYSLWLDKHAVLTQDRYRARVPSIPKCSQLVKQWGNHYPFHIPMAHTVDIGDHGFPQKNWCQVLVMFYLDSIL